MIILLYGLDTYRSRQKLQEIIEHYKKTHKSGLNLKYFDVENLSFRDFQTQFQQSSMFKETKLFILKNCWQNEEFKEKFLGNTEKIAHSKDLVLLYQEGEIAQSDPLLKSLKKSGKTQEFNPLEGEKLKKWLRKKLEILGAKADQRTLEKLIEFVGNDLWRLSNEIKKLVNYRKDKHFQAEDVELLVKPKIETDIFKTIDAIASKNKRKAFELLKKHLEKGDSPLYLLSMINYQFRNLLIVKDLIEKNLPYYLILKKTQLNPWVVKKSEQQANKFTLAELKKIYQKIFQTDLAIKTGKLKPEIALDILIAEI